ncbi:hypothetical protein [Limnobaculum xujianqingii]|uniref:hypothetical protein n=1 Tax=Limnobaculum xujianqingii TaxID=2738837 RepID=UPI00112E866A|nr:hypothetical protein [Limnobaculum xujianqingii]
MLKYSYLKSALLLLSSFLLSGCLITTNSLEDDASDDVAMIRVENYATPLSIERYKQVGSCLQEFDHNSLTAGINFIGIKSTYNKKIDGMPPSPATSILKDKHVMEYKIKAGQPVKVRYQEKKGSMIFEYYNSFTPQLGHSYEIFTARGRYASGVVVNDITQGKEDKPASWELTECARNKTLFGGKEYK